MRFLPFIQDAIDNAVARAIGLGVNINLPKELVESLRREMQALYWAGCWHGGLTVAVVLILLYILSRK